MDPYKTPQANVEQPISGDYKPFKAILYGLLISLGLTSIVSAIEGLLFAVILGADFSNQTAFTATISGSYVFLFTDLVITAGMLYFAGSVVRKYTKERGLIFAFIVALITFIVYLAFYAISKSYELFPFWYNAASFLIVFFALMCGAKPKS